MYQLTDAQLRQEQRGVLRGAAAAAAVCAIVLGASHLLLPRVVALPGDDLDSALRYWVGTSLLIVIWLMAGIRLVSSGRRRSAEDIRGSAYGQPSPRIAVQAAYLQNTLEQVVVMMVTQFAMLMLLRSAAMPLVAASVVLFGVGRLSFYRQYPNGAGARSFGMALTALPSIGAFVVSVAALLSQVWR